MGLLIVALSTEDWHLEESLRLPDASNLLANLVYDLEAETKVCVLKVYCFFSC